jgi:formate/nitrite transporter FocA (FNT family)
MGPGFKSLIGGAVFPIGLIAIVLTGMSLFTGDELAQRCGEAQERRPRS